MARCLSQYHNQYSPEYDGRMLVVEEGGSFRRVRCRVCLHEFVDVYPRKEETVKLELETWREEAILEYHARVQTRRATD